MNQIEKLISNYRLEKKKRAEAEIKIVKERLTEILGENPEVFSAEVNEELCPVIKWHGFSLRVSHGNALSILSGSRKHYFADRETLGSALIDLTKEVPF